MNEENRSAQDLVEAEAERLRRELERSVGRYIWEYSSRRNETIFDLLESEDGHEVAGRTIENFVRRYFSLTSEECERGYRQLFELQWVSWDRFGRVELALRTFRGDYYEWSIPINYRRYGSEREFWWDLDQRLRDIRDELISSLRRARPSREVIAGVPASELIERIACEWSAFDMALNEDFVGRFDSVVVDRSRVEPSPNAMYSPGRFAIQMKAPIGGWITKKFGEIEDGKDSFATIQQAVDVARSAIDAGQFEHRVVDRSKREVLWPTECQGERY